MLFWTDLIQTVPLEDGLGGIHRLVLTATQHSARGLGD